MKLGTFASRGGAPADNGSSGMQQVDDQQAKNLLKAKRHWLVGACSGEPIV